MSERSQTTTLQTPEFGQLRRYERPELRPLGSLSELTKGAGVSGKQDVFPLDHMATST